MPKTPIDYEPKYSLSIVYLKQIMTKQEFNSLIKKYIKAKVDTWGKYNKKKTNGKKEKGKNI